MWGEARQRGGLFDPANGRPEQVEQRKPAAGEDSERVGVWTPEAGPLPGDPGRSVAAISG